MVTATLTNTGSVGLSFAVYPDAYLAAAPTPVTVAASSAGSYVWNAASDRAATTTSRSTALTGS